MTGRETLNLEPHSVRNWVFWGKQFENVRYLPQSARCMIISKHLRRDIVEEYIPPKIKKRNTIVESQKIPKEVPTATKKIEKISTFKEIEKKKIKETESVKEEKNVDIVNDFQSKKNNEEIETMKMKLDYSNKQIDSLKQQLNKTREEWFSYFLETTKNQKKLQFQESEEVKKLTEKFQQEFQNKITKIEKENKEKFEEKQKKIDYLKHKNSDLQKEFDQQAENMKTKYVHLANQKDMIIKNLKQISNFIDNLKSFEVELKHLKNDFEESTPQKIEEIFIKLNRFFHDILRLLINFQSDSLQFFSKLKSNL
eukprot:gene719-8971_t